MYELSWYDAIIFHLDCISLLHIKYKIRLNVKKLFTLTVPVLLLIGTVSNVDISKESIVRSIDIQRLEHPYLFFSRDDFTEIY